MQKINVSSRLCPILVGKVQEIADEHYNGDRTAAIAHLLTLGLEAISEGKTADSTEHNLDKNLYLAIQAEVGRQMKRLQSSVYFSVDTLQSHVMRIDDQLNKKNKRAKPNAAD